MTMRSHCACLVCAWLAFVAGASAHDLATEQFSNAQPDLTWEPEPFTPVNDAAGRYIDYTDGSDNNPGTKDQPWRHHPWDWQASNVAANSRGVATYYFKKGATYHGSLTAYESGTPDQPIRLTVDPDWGAGKATLAGSKPIAGVWHLCDSVESRPLPRESADLTWCTDIILRDAPLGMWFEDEGTPTALTLARTPNWEIVDLNDPRSGWNEIEDASLILRVNVKSADGFAVGDTVNLDASTSKFGVVSSIEDNALNVEIPSSEYRVYPVGKKISNDRVNTEVAAQSRGIRPVYYLAATDLRGDSETGSYQGATLWIEPSRLPVTITTEVIDFFPNRSTLSAKFRTPAAAPVEKSRYFLEGLPRFLDVPGEYAFEAIPSGGYRLFLRLPEDRNPNTARIEAAKHHTLLTIEDRHHIEISGLEFRSANQIAIDSAAALEAPLHASAIQIRGSSEHVSIHHCSFDQLPSGIIGYPSDDGKRDLLDHLTVTDSIFSHIDGSAIAFGNGLRRPKFSVVGSRLVRVDILRNTFHDVGLLALGQLGPVGMGGDAIVVYGGENVEIAGNHVDYVGGPGIQLLLGSQYTRGNLDRPFLRGLVHHNKVVNSLLASYDFGGISAWTGGPVFIYNNISGNPVGYIHSRDHRGSTPDSLQGSSYGIGIYLDGVYKAYVFNNIVWGLSNDLSRRIYNAAAFNEATGFMHTVFQNTFFRFGAGLHRGGGIQHNRNYYLGNLMIDMSHRFIEHLVYKDETEYDTLAFSDNVFQGTPTVFAHLGTGDRRKDDLTLPAWQDTLAQNNALAYDTGVVTKANTVANAEAHDFRPLPGSAASGKGVKVFVPWPLSRVVGEWHFLRTEKQPVTVFGENINMNAEWFERMMFHRVRRNDLSCPESQSADFTDGFLEDWIPGALTFDGQSVYCSLSDASLKDGYKWEARRYDRSLSGDTPASARDTVDIDDESFIIEVVLSAKPAQSDGGIVSKRSEAGYELLIDAEGRIVVIVDSGDMKSSVTSNKAIDDDDWHHVLIEVDRGQSHGITIFIDGDRANGDWSGPASIAGSLINRNDFEVGRSSVGVYFQGRIDFLRISKGTLQDADTTIENLRDWQFSGPFLQDFFGGSAQHGRQNAGALDRISND